MKRRIIKILFTVLLVVFFVLFIFNNFSELTSISLINPKLIPLAGLLVILQVFATGILSELAFGVYGVRLRKQEVFGMASITRLTNYIAPGHIGAGLRALYLKKNHSIDYSKFGSVLVFSNMIQLAISGVIAFVAILLLESSGEHFRPLIFILIFIIVFMFIVLFPANKSLSFINRTGVVPKSSNSKKYTKKIELTLQNYELLQGRPVTLFKLCFWTIITIILTGLNLLVIYKSLGVSISFLESIMLASITNWTMVFSITPAGLGVKEAILLLGASIVGLPAAVTLTVSIVQRLVGFVVVSLLSIYYAPKLYNKSLSEIIKKARYDK